MIFRMLFIIIFLFNFSFASFQKVTIGTIDASYKNKISKHELENIIKEIEYFLESKLNTNIIEYSKEGKSINLVYVPASKLEKHILNNINKLKEKEIQIKKIENSFPKKQKDIKKLKKMFVERNNLQNIRTNQLNDYIGTVNKKKSVSENEYKRIQRYVKQQKSKLHKELKKLKREKSYIKSVVNKYNKKVNLYNSLIRNHNRLNSEIEVMSRSFKKVKGMTFGTKEIRLKTYYKDGKKVKEKSVKSNMNKIDIYGFDSLKELKTILAHEILHLVGIPHINKRNALMNPIIQKNQLEKLSLTKGDIKNFKNHF